MRYKIFAVSITLILCVLVGRLFFLQIIQGNYYWQQSRNNAIRVIPEKAIRGTIFDRNKAVLAQDRLSLNVSVIPQDLKQKDEVFKALEPILEKQSSRLKLNFEQAVSAPFAPVTIAKDVNKSKALLIGEKSNDMPGVIIDNEPGRVYPYSTSAAHVIGYLGMPDEGYQNITVYGYAPLNPVGREGVEKYLEHFLRGQDGGMQIEVDNRGRQINMLGRRSPVRGFDVVLTIDIRMQRALEEFIKTYSRKGAAVVINPRNGEIYALVSSPEFDPNAFILPELSGERLAYLSDKDAPLFNRAVKGQYPAGSIFKIVTAVAALSSSKITVHTPFNCTGQKKVGNRFFKCWSVHNEQDLAKAITHSCNVYFYNTALTVGPEIISEYARLFNLGKPTGVDLPGEASGFVPTPAKQWYPGDTANLSIGQGGLLVTPLQVVQLLSTVANEGLLVTPHLVKEVGAKTVTYPAARKLPLSDEYLKFLKNSLRKVVREETGTAHVLESLDLSIAGKTGTAQAGSNKKHGWFAGFAPVDDPDLAFVIFLEDSPGSSEAVSLTRDFFKAMKAEGVYPFK